MAAEQLVVPESPNKGIPSPHKRIVCLCPALRTGNAIEEYGMSLNGKMKCAGSVVAGAMACFLVYTGAQAAVPASGFADSYQSVPAVAANQSQVIYYREGVVGQRAKTAYVYIDNEFHTTLLPGAFTVFCIAPGAHGLNVALDDAPRYEGKKAQPRTTLEGGKTYFLKVSEAGAVLPTAVTRGDAERQLASTPRQVHLLSRASAVMDCSYTVAMKRQEYLLSGDVLFAFGKADHADAHADSRGTEAAIASQLKDGAVRLDRIDLFGHTDPVGSDAANEMLGMSRALMMRKMAVENGLSEGAISVSSKGRRELLVDSCLGERAHDCL